MLLAFDVSVKVPPLDSSTLLPVTPPAPIKVMPAPAAVNEKSPVVDALGFKEIVLLAASITTILPAAFAVRFVALAVVTLMAPVLPMSVRLVAFNPPIEVAVIPVRPSRVILDDVSPLAVKVMDEFVD